MRNISERVVEKIKTLFMFSHFFSENRVVYEIMCKTTVLLDRPQLPIWRTRIACYIPKPTNTHSHYVIKIKVKVQALRLCTGRTAHRGSRGIVLPFHDHGTRRG